MLKTGDIVKTTGILTNDLEIYRILRRSANGGYWAESLTDPELYEAGISDGTIDRNGILLFDDMVQKV